MNIATRTLLAVGVAAFGYFGIYRPLQLRWGATADEVHRTMPGDEIQGKPIFNATRAVTIAAPAEKIWPWLVQIGYQRAGWYGYDWIENDGIPSSEQIMPEWQSLKVGDAIPIWRGINYPVFAMEQNRYLVFGSADRHDSMAMALYPVEGGKTRLVWRIRLGGYQWNSPMILAQLFTDFCDFIAVRQVLTGVKGRVEGTYRRSNLMYLELGTWFVMFVGFVVALLALILRREWVGPFLLAVLIGSNTVVCVLVRPRLFADIVGVLVIVVAMVALFRGRHRPALKPA